MNARLMSKDRYFLLVLLVFYTGMVSAILRLSAMILWPVFVAALS